MRRADSATKSLPVATILATCVVAAALQACSSDGAGAGGSISSNTAAPDAGDAATTAAPTVDGVETEFWTVFHGAQYDMSPTVVARMEAVHQAHPESSRNTMLTGLAHLWRVVEAGREGAAAASIAQNEGALSLPLLAEAHQREPDNDFLTGFYGLGLHDAGKQLGNAEMIANGRSIVEKVAADAPEIGLFPKMLLDADAAPSDPAFAASVDAMWKLFDTCIEGTLDRTYPDYTPYMSKFTTVGIKRHCWETDKAPHALSGVMLTMGDLLVKQGRVDVAKVFYANAKLSPRYASWAHRGTIDERLSSDLAARALAYSDPDSSKWPRVDNAPFNCTQCHANTEK